MSEKPIIFSTEMVRAILDGRKTQTRRVMKPQPKASELFDDYIQYKNIHWNPKDDYKHNIPVQALKYKLGDVLWVRETWRPVNSETYKIYPKESAIDYAADWSPIHFENSKNPKACNGGKWRPSIHMPRAAARLFLRVTDVRIERVQEISADEAEKEGCKFVYAYGLDSVAMSPYQAFIHLWDCLNAKRGYSWKSNPWVWVIEFERITPELAQTECDRRNNGGEN